MIWLIGFGGEGTFAYTADRLTELSLEHKIVDLDLVSKAACMRHEFDGTSLSVLWDGESFEITSDDVLFVRSFFRTCGNRTRDQYLWSFLDSLSAFCDSVPARAINPPNSGLENGFKLLHLAKLGDVGFKTPRSVAAKSPDWLAEFLVNIAEWVSKGCSGIRTHVRRLSKEDLGQLPAVCDLPVQFQEYLAGHDVRAHFIGKRSIAARIITQADDYRYASREGYEVTIEPCEVPSAIAVRCMEYMRRSRLTFAGFDFRVSEGEWTILECNPMPGYDYYDKKLSGAISQALCEEMRSMVSRAAEPSDGSIEVELDLRRRLFLTGSRRPKTQYS